MSIIYLKVKIKSLAEEARIIRKEEYKAKKQRRYFSGKQGEEENHQAAIKLFWGLRDHRECPVGTESRSALIAYGFLRGRKFSQLETYPTKKGKCVKVSDWHRIFTLVQKYGPEKDHDAVKAAVEKWAKGE